MKKYKYTSYMKKTVYAIFFSMALFPLNSYSQGDKKDKTIEVTMKVVGKDGAAIPGASVVIGEGLLHATTDINGEFTFKAKPSSAVTVTMIGYNKYMGFVAPLAENNQIVLDEADFMKSNDDIVNLPFGNTIFNRYTTDNVTTISGAELAKYPSSDLRNALVGLLPGLIITENDGQPGLNSEENTSNLDATEKVSESVRGAKIVYIVDNLQIDIAEMPLDPDEIESVTLIKDPVNKALYGPAATNGVVLIKTKRGSANERRINVNLEAGVSKVDRFPEFVTGVDYANLNNQAREASGLLPLYDETAIGEYQKNDPNCMLYPNNNFRDMLFKDTRSYQRANVSSYGGNDKIQYSAYVGYTGEGDIYKVGKTADYNRINVRSNLDVKLNDFMKMRFDFAGNLSLRRSPNYNNAASSEVTNINEFPAVIEHANTISPIAFPVYTGIDPETGSMGYGISSNFKYNPLGGLEGNGYYTDMNRAGMGSIALDIDLEKVLKGLTSTTFVSFNGSYMTRIGKSEEYAAFRVLPDDTAEDGYKTIKDRPEELASGESLLHEYNNTRYSFYERLAYDREFGKNYIKAGATFHMSQLTRTGYPEPQRQANAIFDATYAFDNKYIVQASLDYAGANNYAKKNRYKVFPSGGLAWIVSDENFMENIDFIDYLKVRGQAARLGAMYFTENYRYESDWNSPAGNNFGYPGGSATDWFGKNTSTTNSTSYNILGNPDLNWEFINEYSAGVEMVLLNNRLHLDVAYYNRTRDGIIEQVTNLYPQYCGFFTQPFINYGKTRYYGTEVMASYKDNVGDFSYKITALANFGRGKWLKVDEPDYPDDEKWYRSKVGKSTGGVYGLICEGKYESDEEAADSEIKSSFSSDLKKGDLKYRDMNGDKIIDNNDVAYIGNSTPKVAYSINVNLAYKGVELTVTGNGVAGREQLLSNSYYKSGWGDGNYSKWVRDNIGGEYPRLTYYQVANNFQNSTFWLRNTDYFKIQNVELAYNLPAKFCDSIGFGGIRIFARGANLLTISKIKDTDPEAMNSGVTTYPLYSTYVAGLKLTF